MSRGRGNTAENWLIEARRLAIVLAGVFVALLLGQQVPAAVSQDFGDSGPLLNVSGLGLPEQGEHGLFRWSGDRVTLRLQPLGYLTYVRLRVQGVRTEDQPAARLEVSSAGRSLGAYELPRSASMVEVRLPAATLLDINPVLDITSTTFQRPGDRRQLGTVFYGLEQSNGPPPSLPALWPAIALLLSGVLVYRLGSSISGRVRPAMAVALIWGVGLGVLNGLERPWLVFYSWYFVVPPLVGLLLIGGMSASGGRNVGILNLDSGKAEQSRIGNQDSEITGSETITTQPWPVTLAVVAAGLGVLAWHLVAPLIPSGTGPTDNLTWGVALYGALPWPVQILGAVLVPATLVWAWFFHSDEGAPVEHPPPASDPRPPVTRDLFDWLPWILVGLGGIAFALFPVQHSEGDSKEFDAKIPKGAIWRERELLDFYVKARLWQVLKPWLPLPSQIYALVATLSGWVYLGGALLIGKTLGRSTRETLVIMVALMSIGNIVLFFGYIESYALVTVASLLVLWACWQYTNGRVSFRAVGALATLAPLLHGSAIWWGPMVAAAWFLRAWQAPRALRWRRAFADLAGGVSVGVAMLLVTGSIMLIDGYDLERLGTGIGEMGGGDARTIMPLFTTVTKYEHYPFFSWAHLGAVVQEQLLTAPLALVTIIIVVIGAWPGVRRLCRAVPATVTLAVGGAGMFLYSISWNPDLGPRNDWDLLSLPALPLSLLATYLLLRLPVGRARSLALAAYLSVSGVHAAAWVLVHVAGIGY